MPNAAPDAKLVERFRNDLSRLLRTAGLPDDARIGVALSGGPDSMALMLLASAAGPVTATTVDHGLRADSAAEAQSAGNAARALGVPHEIARVAVPPGGQGVQGEARRARYAALAAWADMHGLAAVLTAHHADDQAETLLMRLSRGAGLSGLSGIRPARSLGRAWLLRPLLGWRKTELAAIALAAGIEPAQDLSNDDPRFDRTAARRLLADADWLDPRRMAGSADHLRDADEALCWMIDDLAGRAIEQHGDETVMDARFPREITRRLLLRLLSDRFGKAPDGPAVYRAMAALQRGESTTIADVLAHAKGARWHFRAAPPRRSG